MAQQIVEKKFDGEDPVVSFVERVVSPCIRNQEACIIRRLPSERRNTAVILVAASNGDISKLIGRKGITAEAFRTAVSLYWKCVDPSQKIVLRFESISADNKDGTEGE